MHDRVFDGIPALVRCNAERERAANKFILKMKNMIGNITADVFRDPARMIESVIAENKDLLTAPAAYITMILYLLLNDSGNIFQDNITKIMPVGIVYLFKVIDITHDKAESLVRFQRMI